MKLHDMKLVALAALLVLLTACTVGPDYVRPTVEAPTAFKEMDGWKTAQPRDQELKGKWWEAYDDSLLNSLEEQVNISNQNLAQAEAQYRQARARLTTAPPRGPRGAGPGGCATRAGSGRDRDR